MDANYKTLGGNLMIRFAADDTKGLVKQLSEIDAFFGETKCGACESPNIRPAFFTNDKGGIPKLVCNDCGASLAFFTNRDGELFAGRKDKHGDFVGSNGWEKYKERQEREGGSSGGSQPSRDSGRPAARRQEDEDLAF